MPRRGLILAIALSDDYPDQVYFHIMFHRRDDQQLWDMLLDLCIEGDPSARPVSEAWKQKYGEILDSFRGASTKVFDPALEEKWLTLPAQIHFEVRSPWPNEIPIVIEPQIGLWWRDNMDMTLSVTPQWGELGKMEVGYAQDFLFLPVMAEGEHRLAFDIERKRRRRIYLGSAESDYPYYRHEFDDLGSTTLSKSIRIEGKLSDYLRGIEDAQMIAALRDGLQAKIRMFKGVWIDGELFPDNIFFTLGYDATFSFIQLFQDAAIGLKIELLHDDQLVGTCHLVWPGGPTAKYVAYHGRNHKIYGISERQVEGFIESHDINEGNWTFRVTEDASMALTIPNATSYWTGSFTVPVKFVKEYE